MRSCASSKGREAPPPAPFASFLCATRAYKGSGNYLRAEEWVKDVKELMLPGRHLSMVTLPEHHFVRYAVNELLCFTMPMTCCTMPISYCFALCLLWF